MKRFTFAIALALIMAGSTLAQSRPIPPPLWGGTLNVEKIQGVEAAPGTFDYEDWVCWGKSFSMMNDNASLTISPDYYFQDPAGSSEYLTKVTGGSWTLVYRTTTARLIPMPQNGMLFGTVTGGTIAWNFDKAGNPTSGVMELQVNIAGGTGTFTGIGGAHTTGFFYGTVEYKGGVPVVTGGMNLMY